MRILVMGAGGIGGTVTGSLTEVGADITAVTTNPNIYHAVTERGFRLTGDGEERAVQGKLSLGVPEGERYDLVLLATQPPQVEEAARTALPHLADDGWMMCFQNGLCEQRIAKLVGEDRVIGGIIAWGASMPEPGLYERTSSGGFTLGTLSGAAVDTDPFIREVGALLESIGPVTYTDNLVGARWSKLAINCGISSLGTVAGERLGSLVRSRRVRRLCLEIFTEVVEVAHAEGVRLEKVSGTLDLDWIALTEADRKSRTGSPSLAAKHGILIAVGMRYRRLRSSMLAAIERGRTPAIDFLNGEITARAAQHGIQVPINERIVATVKAIAAGELTSSRELLYNMYGETRP